MTDHAKLYRTAIRLALCLAAVGGIPVAHAINKGQMGQFRYSPSGNSVSIKPNQSGSTGSLAGVGDFRGSTGTQIGTSGWYVGGNAQPSPGGATMNLGHYGDVYFSGSKYPFMADYKVPKSAIIDGLGMLCKNPLICLGLSLTAPSIVSWLEKGDVGINPNEADYPDKPFIIGREEIGTLYRVGGAPWASTKLSACSAFMNYGVDTQYVSCKDPKVSPDGAYCSATCHNSYYNTTQQRGGNFESKEGQSQSRYPASMDDIAPYMTPRDVPNEVVRDLLDKGADIPLPSAPTVTGPESLPGKREVKNNPDGSVTTTTTTNNFRTSGNTITNTSTVTVTQTCMGDGTCSPATTTRTEDPNEPEQSDCEKNPDATRCKDIDLDTPDGEIPKAEKSVTYTPESLFGGGSCPANKVMTVHTGQQLTVWDWDSSCGYITGYMRPIVLVLCGFAAFAIVAGGTKP